MTTETSIYEYARRGLRLSENKTAIWFYGKSLSYRELFERIDHVADNLYALGVRKGTVVTVHLPNCPQAVMAIYAIAKLGGICNMVHPAMPLNALREKMRFTESGFLITADSFNQVASINFTERLVLVHLGFHMGAVKRAGYRLKRKTKLPKEAVPFERLERPCAVKAQIPQPETLANMCCVYLHSSGTTGEPKTVMHSHGAINREAVNICAGCSLGAVNNDVLLGVMPLYHGIGLVLDVHGAISGGTKMVQMAAWNAEFAAKMIRKHAVTLMTVVPRIYYDLMRLDVFSAKSFRFCFSGGDVFKPELKADFFRKEGKPIYEGYGLTEVVASCGVEVHDGVNFGFVPFPNCQFAVRQNNGIVSNMGEGELLVCSNAAMLGYLKSDSNESVWVAWEDKLWFPTGDYGLVDERGNFRFMERIKYTIIRNGNNVFPAEVEKVILKSGFASEACVVGLEDDRNHTQIICAHIVPVAAGTPEVEKKILEYCRANLSAYAVPQVICVTSELPRNAVGKIDRKLLIKQGIHQ